MVALTAAPKAGRSVEHSVDEMVVLTVDSWDSLMAVRTVAYLVAL